MLTNSGASSQKQKLLYQGPFLVEELQGSKTVFDEIETDLNSKINILRILYF